MIKRIIEQEELDEIYFLMTIDCIDEAQLLFLEDIQRSLDLGKNYIFHNESRRFYNSNILPYLKENSCVLYKKFTNPINKIKFLTLYDGTKSFLVNFINENKYKTKINNDDDNFYLAVNFLVRSVDKEQNINNIYGIHFLTNYLFINHDKVQSKYIFNFFKILINKFEENQKEKLIEFVFTKVMNIKDSVYMKNYGIGKNYKYFFANKIKYLSKLFGDDIVKKKINNFARDLSNLLKTDDEIIEREEAEDSKEIMNNDNKRLISTKERNQSVKNINPVKFKLVNKGKLQLNPLQKTAFNKDIKGNIINTDHNIIKNQMEPNVIKEENVPIKKSEPKLNIKNNQDLNKYNSGLDVLFLNYFKSKDKIINKHLITLKEKLKNDFGLNSKNILTFKNYYHLFIINLFRNEKPVAKGISHFISEELVSKLGLFAEKITDFNIIINDYQFQINRIEPNNNEDKLYSFRLQILYIMIALFKKNPIRYDLILYKAMNFMKDFVNDPSYIRELSILINFLNIHKNNELLNLIFTNFFKLFDPNQFKLSNELVIIFNILFKFLSCYNKINLFSDLKKSKYEYMNYLFKKFPSNILFNIKDAYLICLANLLNCYCYCLEFKKEENFIDNCNNLLDEILQDLNQKTKLSYKFSILFLYKERSFQKKQIYLKQINNLTISEDKLILLKVLKFIYLNSRLRKMYGKFNENNPDSISENPIQDLFDKIKNNTLKEVNKLNIDKINVNTIETIINDINNLNKNAGIDENIFFYCENIKIVENYFNNIKQNETNFYTIIFIKDKIKNNQLPKINNKDYQIIYKGFFNDKFTLYYLNKNNIWINLDEKTNKFYYNVESFKNIENDTIYKVFFVKKKGISSKNYNLIEIEKNITVPDYLFIEPYFFRGYLAHNFLCKEELIFCSHYVKRNLNSSECLCGFCCFNYKVLKENEEYYKEFGLKIINEIDKKHRGKHWNSLELLLKDNK